MWQVSVSTGTKCVSGEHISVTGSALNDCHAEIISRRCLMDFLYSQLEKVAGGGTGEKGELVLESAPGGGYRLKENVRFHLYINTAPCGDARIFSPHEERFAWQGGDDHPNRRARGQLRTKIESGEVSWLFIFRVSLIFVVHSWNVHMQIGSSA